MDYAAIATAISTEFSTGLPAFAALIGLVLGIPLVFKIYKRLAGR